MSNFLPTIPESREFFADIDNQFKAPDWFLCMGKGCCNGDAQCCKHSLQVMLTWLEMELIWDEVQKWSTADRRNLLKTCKKQVEEIRATSPELFDRVENTETVERNTINDVKLAMGKVDHVCPLLGSDNLCTVYESRPLVCRGFGQTARVGTNDEGKPEGFMMSCDANHKHMVETNPDQELPNFTKAEQQMYDLAAPRIKMNRTALVIKPLQFWVLDLADESGDLTNPTDLFINIRRMIDTGLAGK